MGCAYGYVREDVWVWIGVCWCGCVHVIEMCGGMGVGCACECVREDLWVWMRGAVGVDVSM